MVATKAPKVTKKPTKESRFRDFVGGLVFFGFRGLQV
jgi:hypothetical protein